MGFCSWSGLFLVELGFFLVELGSFLLKWAFFSWSGLLLVELGSFWLKWAFFGWSGLTLYLKDPTPTKKSPPNLFPKSGRLNCLLFFYPSFSHQKRHTKLGCLLVQDPNVCFFWWTLFGFLCSNVLIVSSDCKVWDKLDSEIITGRNSDCEVRDILDTGLILGRSKLAQMG